MKPLTPSSMNPARPLHFRLPLPTPPPPPPHSSGSSFPAILPISILGILTTSVLLLSYYVFVIKCCLNWRRPDVIGLFSRSRRRSHREGPFMFYSTAVEGRGLEESAIQAIPTFLFRKLGDGEVGKSFHECAVCLNEFQEEERIRLLPNCCHVFHIDCIDTWLQTHANCPLCRSDITSTAPLPTNHFLAADPHQNPRQGEDFVIEVRELDAGIDQTQPVSRTDTNPSPRKAEQRLGAKKGRKLHHVSSMGDECIEVRRVKDEQFSVQPMRRSFSMDSSTDRLLYVTVQKMLQQNPHFQEVGSEISSTSSSGGFGRARRSLFLFGQSRSSRSAVLPVEM